jgi:hydroxyacid-oxoacid transhydrogenase
MHQCQRQSRAVPYETVITWQASPLRMGLGATEEVGFEARRLHLESVLIVTDPGLVRLGLPRRVQDLLAADGVEAEVYDEVRVEPTVEGCEQMAGRLRDKRVDGYVAVGGGSSIDSAKVLNVLQCHPGVALRRYLNRPIGQGLPLPGPLKPLIALPTTAGSGSECTPWVALGVDELRLKTGMGDDRLRPAVAIVDPCNTITLPAGATAASGYDVLTHACEAFTARRFDRRPPYTSPADRPIYVGANLISDVWAELALGLVGRYLRRAVLGPHDIEARVAMSQAATFAAMGFGNAGTHVPHASAYPIAGLVREYRTRDYEVDHPLVAHGEAVVATAPAAFRFTYAAAPERHLRAAELLGADLSGITATNGQEVLPATLHRIVQDTGGPSGVSAFGYSSDDVPALAEGALRQQRLLSCCPRDVTRDDLTRILDAAMHY